MRKAASHDCMHPRVFEYLESFAGFYGRLSDAVIAFPAMGIGSLASIDTHAYASMRGTLESIRIILLEGRINDAYALLRKYHDSAIINIYVNLFLDDNFSHENFVVETIQLWIQGEQKLPKFRIMAKYIRSSARLKPITEALMADDRYMRIRDRCNDHTHYNFFRHVMINDVNLRARMRQSYLDVFADDLCDLFILHLACIFSLRDHYLASSDYLDALECGIQPEENSQYWVAPAAQAVFNDVIASRRPDIATIIKRNTSMYLS